MRLILLVLLSGCVTVQPAVCPAQESSWRALPYTAPFDPNWACRDLLYCKCGRLAPSLGQTCGPCADCEAQP